MNKKKTETSNLSSFNKSKYAQFQRDYMFCVFLYQSRTSFAFYAKIALKCLKQILFCIFISGSVGKICIQYARHLVCIIIVCCQLWMWDEFTDIVFVRLFSLFDFFFPVLHLDIL